VGDTSEAQLDRDDFVQKAKDTKIMGFTMEGIAGGQELSKAKKQSLPALRRPLISLKKLVKKPASGGEMSKIVETQKIW